MCAAGASYGGHLSNWIEATSTRYKCIVSHAGEVDLTTQWGESDFVYEREIVNGGPPWAGNPIWREQSPITYAANWKTPILLSIGERDYRVPLGNTLENWATLQRMHVPSRLLVWPDAWHWILEARGQPAFLRGSASLARSLSKGAPKPARVSNRMNAFQSDFLRTLHERGFIHQQTDAAALDAAARRGVVTAYVGYDATADSLHVGNLVSIMLLRHLQRTGHRPIVLMGGGTTKVGDPSGRDETRQLLSESQIAANIASIRQIFEHYLDFESGLNGAIMVNNDDWLGKLEYIPFLRDIGRHFTINRMLTMDSVRLRLEREQPLTFLEFNYMILQGYDFVELNKRHGCTLQMGGSDQWGNIVQGVELGRRVRDAELFGLTCPLITTSSGAKMGKTASGAVWLNPKRLSPYDYWQFWRNTEDADVGRFLRMFTELPLDEIARLEALRDADINEAKKILANEATRLCHGAEAAEAALATASRAFSGATADGLPTFALKAGTAAPVIEIVVALGLASSRGEARRLIEQGGVRLNDAVVRNVDGERRGIRSGFRGRSAPQRRQEAARAHPANLKGRQAYKRANRTTMRR